MEHLAHRHAVVAVGLEVLRQGGVVPRLDPPVGVEVVDPGGVGPAARQHGGAAGSAHGLLRGRDRGRGGGREEKGEGPQGQASNPSGPTRGQSQAAITDLSKRIEENFAFGCQLVDVW